MNLTLQELTQILVGLRLTQCEPSLIEEFEDYFEEAGVTPLTDDETSALAERLNCAKAITVDE